MAEGFQFQLRLSAQFCIDLAALISSSRMTADIDNNQVARSQTIFNAVWIAHGQQGEENATDYYLQPVSSHERLITQGQISINNSKKRVLC